MIMTAILLAILAAVVDYCFGIKEPWRKFIFIGIAILFILGLFLFLAPGYRI